MSALQSKQEENLKAAGETPALVGYITMAMKLNPNLERACGFAAGILSGKMGRELRRKISEGNLRLYSGISDVISNFAKKWDGACPELGRALDLIQSSTNERVQSSRARTLDRAMNLALEGARDRMRKFSSSIHLPVLLLYCMGVLVPLILVGILPVLSVMGGGLGLVQIVALYCFILPLLVYVLSRQILSKRPSGMEPPILSVEGFSPRPLLASASVAIPFLVPAFFIRDTPDVSGLAALWGVVLAVSVYFFLTSAPAFRRWKEALEMEEQLPDALIHVGNRVAEGRPAEEAFEQHSRSSGGKGLGRVLGRAAASVRVGGMGLRASLFDESRGALREVHSEVVRGVLGMLVDFMEKSTRAAGEAMLQAAEHLRKLGEVRAEMRRMMEEVVGSMRSVALFFGPLVASVTARMQGVLSSKAASATFLGSGMPPTAFFLVLAVYTVILAALLTDFSVQLEFGEDRVARRVAVASAIPVALGVFTAGSILGGQALSSLVG
ncbi:MAG: hypothetical protein AB1476_01060 [Candidatus Hadarchaeota archaeon]